MFTARMMALAAVCTAPLIFGEIASGWVICNGKTPQIGNCGTQSLCENRFSEEVCTGTHGTYFGEQAGIDCVTGTVSTHCELAGNGTCPPPAPNPETCMKCTCQYVCDWDCESDTCSQGAAVFDQGHHACGWRMKRISKSCTVGT